MTHLSSSFSSLWFLLLLLMIFENAILCKMTCKIKDYIALFFVIKICINRKIIIILKYYYKPEKKISKGPDGPSTLKNTTRLLNVDLVYKLNRACYKTMWSCYRYTSSLGGSGSYTVIEISAVLYLWEWQNIRIRKAKSSCNMPLSSAY